MNKKLFQLGILLLVGLALGGCVVVGGHGYRGYGYYDYPDGYDYYSHEYPYIDKPHGWSGHHDRRGHREWGGYRGSGDGVRHRKY